MIANFMNTVKTMDLSCMNIKLNHAVVFCEYTNTRNYEKKKIKEKSMSTLNRKYVMFMGNCELVSSSTQSRSRLFLAFVFISYHKKIVYLLRYTLSLKWYRFWNCNFVKVYTFLQEIRCLKKKKVEFLQMYRT